MDNKIYNFAQSMDKELTDNVHKGNWEDWKNVNEMISELEWHKAKLLFALKDSDNIKIKEYLADCGNILMFIGNTLNLYQ